MAEGNEPDSQGSNRRSSAPEDAPPTNPFIVFRRLVDDEINSAWQAFGAMHAPFSKAIEDMERGHHAAWRRFSESYERAMNPERIRIPARTGEDSAALHAPATTTAVSPTAADQKIRHTAKHTDTYTDAGQCPMRFEPEFDLVKHLVDPVPRQTASPASKPVPFSSFFSDSPYSPMALESEELTKGKGPWGLAFADLLAEQMPGLVKDDPLLHNFDGPSPQTLFERIASGSRYFEESMNHGSSLNRFRDESWTDTVWDKMAAAPAQAPASASDTAASGPKTPIVAMLTSTETRTLPDGTVSTRTLLKRRFADGTEQQEEQTDVRPALASTEPRDWRQEEQNRASKAEATTSLSSQISSRAAALAKADAIQQPESAKKRGFGDWFWSS